MAILALIEKRSRFLSREWRREKPYSVLMDFYLARNVAVEYDRLARQSLLCAQRHVVACQNAGRLCERAQRVENLAAIPVEARAHELHYQPLVITIADQGWQSVGFPVYQSHRVGVVFEWNAASDRRSDSLVPPGLIDHRVRVLIQQAEGNLRQRAPQSPAEWLAAIVMNKHSSGVHHRPLRDVAAINPRVACQPATRALGAHASNSHASIYSVASTLLVLPYTSCEYRIHARRRSDFDRSCRRGDPLPRAHCPHASGASQRSDDGDAAQCH